MNPTLQELLQELVTLTMKVQQQDAEIKRLNEAKGNNVEAPQHAESTN
jgi:hypothetical protein